LIRRAARPMVAQASGEGLLMRLRLNQRRAGGAVIGFGLMVQATVAAADGLADKGAGPGGLAGRPRADLRG
jgi:hypothetical protein